MRISQKTDAVIAYVGGQPVGLQSYEIRGGRQAVSRGIEVDEKIWGRGVGMLLRMFFL